MKTLTKETYQMIKLNLKNLLIFEVVYRLITGSVFLQAVNYGLRFSLRMAGYSYLTMGNLGHFLIKPWTILVILGITLVGLLLMMIEAGGLIAAYSSAAYSLRLSPVDILLEGVGNLVDEIKKRNVKLFGVVFIEIVLINSYYLYRILSHVKPLDFMMKTMLGEGWVRVLLLVVAIVFIVIAIPSTFAPHGCMIERKSFRDSMNLSRDLLAGRRKLAVPQFVLYQVFLVLGMIGCYLLCMVFAGVFVVTFVDKALEFAFLMEAGARIEWALLFIASIVSSVVYFASVTVWYYQLHNRVRHEARWDFNYGQGRALSRKNGVIVVAVLGIASGVCLFDTAYNGNIFTKAVVVETEITAHRGSSKTAPENTLEALAAAVEEMADRVEIDVQETADGLVVLSHDSTLKRTAGVNKRIADLTYDELLQLDVGSWFSKEFEGTKIPTLEAVMDYAKGKIDLNIEIKNLGNASGLPEKVLELVNDHEMQEQCVITSTNLNYLRRIKELQPEIRTGYILSAAYGEYYNNEDIDFISIRSNFVTESMMEKCHEAGKTVHAWTVNSKDEMERLRVLGVDNVITDYPVRAREVLYREDVTESLLEYLRVLLK
ncbi:MAG: glycerophosphodiester phosphodiesterase [Hungatella hathewayi]|nr:glycerophosphodiester phosphodiesterase [Hungatella hathewayi]